MLGLAAATRVVWRTFSISEIILYLYLVKLTEMATSKSSKKGKEYAMIYFRDKKPLKKSYESSVRAFNDYEDKGCIFVELFNENGTKLSSYPNPKK